MTVPPLPLAASLLAIVAALAPSAAASDADSPGQIIHVAPPFPDAPPGDGSREHPLGTLAEAIDLAARSGSEAVLELAPGRYDLSPTAYTDPSCGNCQDPAQAIPATLGLRISGDALLLRGAGMDSVTIVTHAGYGLLFEDCRDCRMEGVTVTGGERDTSGRATDAAVVVRRSALALDRCRIAHNLGDSATIEATVVGIMGICGREGARLRLTRCEILGNSWDGIALYRDAVGHIEDCVIDGVDSGRGGPARGGRGVAIGVTWNAQATILGNLVRRYWKGIGLFVDAEAEVRENIIEEVLTWGIALWDADAGRPYGDIASNAIYRTGACGISVTRGLAGGREDSRVVHNALVETGRNPRYDDGEVYCSQRALAVHATRPALEIGDNYYTANREPGDRPGAADMDEEIFRTAAAALIERLQRRPALRASAFLAAFGEAEE
ncbi:MAG: right-handed parallel beta-helix repeat-containing protein [Candidatus Eisenbacteria bacterium]